MLLKITLYNRLICSAQQFNLGVPEMKKTDNYFYDDITSEMYHSYVSVMSARIFNQIRYIDNDYML